jgi:hypothetical protein
MAKDETAGQVRNLTSALGQGVSIDLKDELEMARWAKRLGVPVDQFRIAAQQAGPRLDDIKQHLIGAFNSSGPTS